MEQLDKEERKRLMRVLDKYDALESMVQGHHKRLKDIDEWLHFPPDIGPADHITDHVANKLSRIRKGDLTAFIVRSTIWTAILAAGTLIMIGVKQWIFRQ